QQNRRLSGESAGRKMEPLVMAWRPTEYLKEGELDNTTLGKVTGWLRFAGMSELVTLDLVGDFHRDIRGAKLRLKPREQPEESDEARSYTNGLASLQTGDVGDITAGLPPRDYVDYPYVEWYGRENGRVVLELGPDEVEVIGQPLPWQETERVDIEKTEELLANYLAGMVSSLEQTAGEAPGGVLGRVHPGDLPITKELTQ